MKLTYNEQYKNYSVDMKSIQPNEIFDFTLKFDDPKTGEGRFGEWQLYNVTVHTEEGDKDASFFPKGQSPEDFVKLGEWLKKFSKGTRITLQHTLVQGDKGWYSKWLDVNADTESTSQTQQTSSENKPVPTPSQSDEELVQGLVDASGGQKREQSWVQQTLINSGISDPQRILLLLGEYNKKW